jgi:hypothetical protein
MWKVEAVAIGNLEFFAPSVFQLARTTSYFRLVNDSEIANCLVTRSCQSYTTNNKQTIKNVTQFFMHDQPHRGVEGGVFGNEREEHQSRHV